MTWSPASCSASTVQSIQAEHEAGDHLIVVGRVRELDLEQEGRPLVFYRGGYGRFEP